MSWAASWLRFRSKAELLRRLDAGGGSGTDRGGAPLTRKGGATETAGDLVEAAG